MPKKAVINRNKKRIELVEAKRQKRNQLRSDAYDMKKSLKERELAQLKLQKMPRDTSPSRRRRRCKICGRGRGCNRLTGLCRLHMRIATLSGMVPGMRKASW